MVQLAEQITDRLPRVGDAAAAERGLARWSRLPDGWSEIGHDLDLDRLLAGIFGNSPYLSELLLSEPALLRSMLAQGPDAALEALLARARAPRRPASAPGSWRDCAGPSAAWLC